MSVSGPLGAQFLLWEYATAIASRLIGINPFDQPDVESAKVAARGMLESRAEIAPAAFVASGIAVRERNLDLSGASTVADAVKAFLKKLDTDSGYVSIHAYLDREANASALSLREKFAKATRRPVTFGWGPRFLHSTGQYHKGGPKQGIFLQIVAESNNDLPVPGRNFTFGELIASQAAGDAIVLAELGRPVLTLTLTDVEAGLAALSAAV